jgi:hypothetical protein
VRVCVRARQARKDVAFHEQHTGGRHCRPWLVGAELLGLDYTEAKLLAYAYAFATQLRKLPRSTPALPSEP